MANRNRLVKVPLFDKFPMNLLGGTIVGQNGDMLIVERPAPKERVKKVGRPRKLKQVVVDAEAAIA